MNVSQQARTRKSLWQVRAAAELERRRRSAPKQSSKQAKYGNNLLGYAETVLGAQFTEDQKRVAQSVQDFPITIVKSANAVGKTHVAAHLAVAFYQVFEDAQVYTAAAPPEDNLKRLLWGEIGSILQKHSKEFAGHQTNVLHVERNPRSFLTGVTIPASGTPQQREAKFSGKHAPHLMFVCDEGDAIPDEVYAGIEACGSGGWFRLLIMFNPRHESGPVYRMERDGLANVVSLSAFDHPNVRTGEDTIPGAVTLVKTIKRINEWTRPLIEGEKVDSEVFGLPEFLIGQTAKKDDGTSYPPLPEGRRKIVDPSFSYMVLGQYPAQSEQQLISKSWIAAARSRWDLYVAANGERPPVGVRPIHGQDVAEFGADLNAACFRYGGYVAPIQRWGGVDPMVTADRAAGLAADRQAEVTNVDCTGVGAGVAPAIERKGCKASRVMVASSPTETSEQGEFDMLRDQLYWAVREWLRTDTGSMLPPDERLCEELATPTYSTTIRGNKIKVMTKEEIKKLLRRSPDGMDSLALTFAPASLREIVFF